jgi:hypothetical protein
VSMPTYSALASLPNPAVPADLGTREYGPELSERSNLIKQELLEPGRRPGDNEPLFFTFAEKEKGWPITLEMPEPTGRCLLAFSSPRRAADYCRVQLGPLSDTGYRSSTPRQFVHMLADLRKRANIKSLAIDRCPRCNIFNTIQPMWDDDPGRAIQAWAISKSIELTRFRMYMDYAISAARRQDWTVARTVALALVAHVSPEPPHVHLLLGKLAIQLRDAELLREAQSWLHYLDCVDLSRELSTAKEKGAVEF